MGSLKFRVRAQRTISNQVIFWNVSVACFSQNLSGKYAGVLSKPDSACPDEPIRNQVLLQKDLIPENFFPVWTKNSGFRLKISSRVVNTAFYVFREKNSRGAFSKKKFLSSWFSGFECNLFWILAEKFQLVVNSAFYLSRGLFRVSRKLFFFQLNQQTFFVANWAKNFVSFVTSNSWNDCQKGLVRLQTNTFNEVIFSEKRSFSLFFGFLVGKLLQVVKTVAFVDRRTIEENDF